MTTIYSTSTLVTDDVLHVSAPRVTTQTRVYSSIRGRHEEREEDDTGRVWSRYFRIEMNELFEASLTPIL